MVNPLSLVGLIIEVVKLIGTAAAVASQNKHKCLELAERANNLALVLPRFEYAAANDTATACLMVRLKDALGEALRLIETCHGSGLFSCDFFSRKATKLDNVDRSINNCIMDLNLNSQAHASVHVDQTSHYQAQGGGASSACVGYPPPQHAAVFLQWAPGPAPSGSNLSSLYTLPTVNKVFNRVYDGLH